MNSGNDYSVLDRPELLNFIFYPRNDCTPPPPGASDYQVTVGGGIYVSCRLYFHSPGSPSIVFFHGNGEVVSDYDYVAPVYQSIGVNLFVADYRGYGQSTGRPTISAIMADSHAVFSRFREISHAGGYSGPLLVMGRSLGSYPAVELASNCPEVQGLVIESGFISVGRLLSRLGLSLEMPGLREIERLHLSKAQSIRAPSVVIHGDMDSLVPLDEGKRFYDSLGTQDKRLTVIHGAGHNDILLAGREQYLAAIRDLTERIALSENRGR